MGTRLPDYGRVFCVIEEICNLWRNVKDMTLLNAIFNSGEIYACETSDFRAISI